MNQYTPRHWQPHERPSLPGSPSTPLHSPGKRWAYAAVGLLVALTGALGNALVVANLPYRRSGAPVHPRIFWRTQGPLRG